MRAFVAPLPRSYEVLVRDRVKFRVGQIVYVAFSRDETLMGFAFSKEEREALVASEPEEFLMPAGGDLRFNWVIVRLAAIDIRRCASSSSTRGDGSCPRSSRLPTTSASSRAILAGRAPPGRAGEGRPLHPLGC